jgi:hypothetical protein
MNLKKCPSCKRPQTTRTAKFVGRLDGFMYFNCRSCWSTFIVGKCFELIRKAGAVGACFLAVALIGCEQNDQSAKTATPAGDAPNLVAPPAPANDAELTLADLAGLWNSVKVGSATKWCTKDENDEWTCVAGLYYPPACEAPGVWPIIAGYSVFTGGFPINAQDGTIDFTVGKQPVSYADDQLILPPTPGMTQTGYVWGFEVTEPDTAVLTYGPGCSLLFKRIEIPN